MTRENVKVKPGYEYDRYFPKAELGTILQKRNAKVSDTLRLIPTVIRKTAWQTRKFAHEVIKADTLEETCSRLWHFVYDHIAYCKDQRGKEQVRDAARIWHDRHNFQKDENGNFLLDEKGYKIPGGVDCDCMTTFICSVLYNLEIKNVYFRITRYEEPHWEHIYPVIKLPNGKEIIIDCVLHQFNQEAKYTAKQDTAMDLEYLNGVSDSTMNKLSDAPDLMGIMDEQEAYATLGKLFKKKAASGGGGSAPKKGLFKKKTADQKKANKGKIKKFLGKGLHITNRINPVTVALRNGVLAGMKLNFMKIAEALRWTYLTPEQAQAKGANMTKYNKLKGVREKLEKIFYGAGGKKENLKKSILHGRGNRDKAVPMNGLGYVDYTNVDVLHEEMPLNELLGREIYYSENVEGLEGLDGFEGLEGFSEEGDLGSATAASVAAATTVLGTIAALIKSIGSIFPGKAGKVAKGGTSKKTKSAGGSSGGSSGGSGDDGGGESEESSGSSEESGATEEGGNSENASSASSEEAGDDNNSAAASESNSEDNNSEEDGTTNGKSASKTAAKSDDDSGDDGELKPGIKAKAKAFWETHKKWMKPTGITVGALGLIYLTYQLLKKKTPAKQSLSLSGLGNKRKKRKPKPKQNILHGIKSRKGGKTTTKRKTAKRKTITLL